MSDLIVLSGTDLPTILNLDQFMSFEYSEVELGPGEIITVLTCVSPTGFTMTIKGEAANLAWAAISQVYISQKIDRDKDSKVVLQ